jgi:hypothetical protein
LESELKWRASVADEQSYKINYKVKVTRAAIKQGKKLPISEKQRLEIVKDVKMLIHWSENEANFDYESAFGAIEYKYDLPGKKWIRVIVFQDDVRKVMWVIRVFAKKTNQIEKVHRIGIETSVTQIKAEIRKYEKEQKYIDARNKLNLVSGGKKNE